MTRTWTTEELEKFAARIEAARAGDVGKAASLLNWAALCLEREWPLPEPLRHYLITAFREITKEDTATGGIVLPPHPSPKDLAELKKNIRYLEETRDANAALNLKRPRGRKRSKAGVLLESWYLDVEVTEEMKKGAKSLEEAVGAVSDRRRTSDRTVTRARKTMKGTRAQEAELKVKK